MNNSKTITVMMGEKEMTFSVSLDDWNRCVNALQPDNKIAPMHNFLINVSANDETKELVKQAYNDALTSDIFGAVIKEFKPDVEITVKKYKTGPGKLSRTD
ncbi:hypothetical protein CAPTEDRAFT_117495 [Capitella teleta]|uniref:Uncharacterized protein n=1 Tax=Capitella teleta TaxID=283909 RepID=R7V981_CAPTE|nr:hypothetical protein CAPTEDRAFT_117495 [Capitella teleta]|eukprot:ELU12285.1 hypothetical protein CAPTEDRAFT_117495 [Capitella teleta]